MKSKNEYLDFVFPALSHSWQSLAEIKQNNPRIEYSHLDELRQYQEIEYVQKPIPPMIDGKLQGRRGYFRLCAIVQKDS